MRALILIAGLAGGLLALPLSSAQAEILAMMNYESKTPEALAALNMPPMERREGIAIIDVDPESANFGKILADIPMPPDQIVHHIFYDRTMTKAYVTSLGSPSLQVIDMARYPYRLETIEVEGCAMGEDVIVDEANQRWYLTCMHSGHVFVGDVATDEVLGRIDLPGSYPHGIGISTVANRIIVTSTVSGDLSEPHEFVSIVDATTYELLGTKRLSLKPEGSGEAPVEILFAPGADRPIAYVTNMFGGTLWTLTWDEASAEFDTAQVFDFGSIGAGIALEMYFNEAGDRLYVTTGKPGQLHVFDVAEIGNPKYLKAIPAGEGAHHVAITKDERYAFVQNALLNLPGLSDGGVTVVNLQTNEVVASMDTLKDSGFNPNCIVLLPEWNSLGGH